MRPARLHPGEALALVRRLPICPDPVDLFAAVSHSGRDTGSVLLETAEVAGTEGARGGKSLVVARSALQVVARGRQATVRALNENGAALLPWLAERVTTAEEVRVDPHELSCRYAERYPSAEEERLKVPSVLDVLRALLMLEEKSKEPAAAPMLVGGFAYDLLEHVERLPVSRADPLRWPDLELFLPDRLVWLDHEHRCASVVAHLFGGVEPSRYSEATAAIVDLVQAAQEGGREPVVGGGGAGPKDVSVDLDDQAYVELVLRLKQHIVAGDLFQIVPSRTFQVPCADPLAAYRQLRGVNPSPYMYFLRGSAGVLLGSSPETAVRVDRDRRMHIRPIAGTRPRGRQESGQLDADLDSRLEAELRLDAKELAEHMMLVDLARNDVARVCEPGTRIVERLLQVERYSHVMHLVSHVSGILRPDLDPLHAYEATMNMGTLTGAPKVRAAQLLRRYEATRRGPYGGAVGYLTADGNLDSAIVIRSAVVQGAVAHVRAGAGVVYDSNPEAEARETLRKAQPVIEAIGLAGGGEVIACQD